MVVGVTGLLGYNVTEIEIFLNKLRPPDNYFKNLDSRELKENGVMHMCSSLGRSINKQLNRQLNK
jgi:hypothetical protein